MVFEFTGSQKSRGELAAASPGSLPSNLRQIEIARLREIKRRFGERFNDPSQVRREIPERLAELERLERAGQVPEKPAGITPRELAVSSGMAETQKQEAHKRSLSEYKTRTGTFSVFAGPGAGERLARPSRVIPGEKTLAVKMMPTIRRDVPFVERVKTYVRDAPVRARFFIKTGVGVRDIPEGPPGSPSEKMVASAERPISPSEVRELPAEEEALLLPRLRAVALRPLEEPASVGDITKQQLATLGVIGVSFAKGVILPFAKPKETIRGGYVLGRELIREPVATVKMIGAEVGARPLEVIPEFIGFGKGIGAIERIGVRAIKTGRVVGRVSFAKEIPIKEVISPQVQRGAVLAEVRTVKEALTKFEKGKVPEGVKVYHAAERAPHLKEIGISPKAAFKQEDVGLFVSPKGEVMEWPLRLKPKDVYPETKVTLIPFKEVFKPTPAIAEITVKGVERLPKEILDTPSFKDIQRLELELPLEGKAFITAKLEKAVKGRGRAETEGFILPKEIVEPVKPKAVVARLKGFEEFVWVGGEAVKIPKWRIAQKTKSLEVSSELKIKKVTESVEKFLKETEAGAKEYRRLAEPPVRRQFVLARGVPLRRAARSTRAPRRAELSRDVRPVRPVLELPRAVDRRVERVSEPRLRPSRVRSVDRLRLHEPRRRGESVTPEERIDTPKISEPKIPATKMSIPRLELKKRKKFEIKKKRRKGPLFYTPGFTGRVIGVPELKLTKKEALKLLKKTHSGLGIRPSVRVVGLK